ncbi:MAG TPA: glycosyl hydrolase-related protein [Anaerolineales bacterium]|nr:glycosyl hydrolase-related protein [Anaerolineales bacterium]
MRNIYIISHTHWDREWYRSFQSFRLRLVHLVDGLLDLLEKDPHFKYFMLDGQTIVLDDYLALRPEKEGVLRKFIQQGRILIGPWHILPDMFLVGPESHIRNLLQGDRTARKFGPKMMVGYIPDPFGHPGQVPQILQGFDIDTACLWRGLDEQPAEFWWQAPDGSQVLMAYLRDSYSNGAALPAADPAAFSERLSAAANSLAAHSSVTDYLVMFGTDHMEPPADTSSAIKYANKTLPNTHVIHSTLPRFLAAIQEEIKKQKSSIPTVTGELRACKRMHLLPGVLSTRIWIKQRNHASENYLLKWVEPFCTWQELATGQQPATLTHKAEIIRQAWRMLMENHPHDSICGCSIDQVHDEMKIRFDQVDQVGETLVRQSLEAMVAAIDTSFKSNIPDGNPCSALVVFNPNSAAQTDVASTAIELPDGADSFDLLDESGTSLPYQTSGQGGRVIFNMSMDPQALREGFSSINDGRVIGMSVQEVSIRRDGSQVYIDARLSDEGEPNLPAWKTARKTVYDCLADRAITTYHVLARSSSALRIIFVASQVPGLGYRTYWVLSRPAVEKTPVRMSPFMRMLLPVAALPAVQKLATRKRYSKPPYQIENEFYLVEGMKDGSLSILDKNTGLKYAGMNTILDGGDCGDEYNYAPPETDRFTGALLKHVTLASGAIQHTLELELELKTPVGLAIDRKSRAHEETIIPITCTVTLTAGVPRVDIRTVLSNSARDHRLRIHFPAPFSAESGSQDGHFEVVERQVKLPQFDESWVEQPRPEVPQRVFTDVSDGKHGLMVANRGLPEVEVLKNAQGNAEIALTILRCVGWLSRDDFSTRQGHAGPFLQTPGAQMQGKWIFEYSIIPHAGRWDSAYWQAYAFDAPLQAVAAGCHTGYLAPAASLVEVTPETFVISAVKPAKDERGWLVRGYNITGEPIDVSLKPWRPFKKVALVNLAEEHQSNLSPDPDGMVNIPVRPHQIVSVLLFE